MNRFKEIVSNHNFIPIKMAIILYIIMWVYNSVNHVDFDYVGSAVNVFGILIIYVIIHTASEFLSFNDKHNATHLYSLNEKINDKINILLIDHKVIDNKSGVYSSELIQHENGTHEFIDVLIKNPVELYYTIRAYKNILSTIGTYSSSELSSKLNNLLKNTEEMMGGIPFDIQYYGHRD